MRAFWENAKTHTAADSSAIALTENHALTMTRNVGGCALKDLATSSILLVLLNWKTLKGRCASSAANLEKNGVP